VIETTDSIFHMFLVSGRGERACQAEAELWRFQLIRESPRNPSRGEGGDKVRVTILEIWRLCRLSTQVIRKVLHKLRLLTFLAGIQGRGRATDTSTQVLGLMGDPS
jgi:hypothetical protein